ncbi:MAG TPA: inorganic phosphate transporter [Planctomycetes bacterium]|nr:inorganic phosphate transporter [Planctomycetota bacterium]
MLVLLLAALALAFANGANDNFKATATLYGSRNLDYEGSRRLATAAQVAGSLASVLLAGALLRAFGGKGLVPDAVVGDPIFLTAVGAGAAATVLLATRVGLPISTTHALVGGLAGAGSALAPGQLSWEALGGSYFLPLLVSPLLALACAGVLYPLAHRARRALGIEAEMCLCIGRSRDLVRQTADGAWIVERTGMAVSVDQIENCRTAYSGEALGVSIQSIVDGLHRVSAFSLGFARGLNDTPKVLALLVTAGWAGLDPRLSLLIIAGTMATGGFLRARRVAETLAHGITSLSHGQGLLANAISSGLVIGASLLGSPVSTTHVSTGALFGIGVWNDETDWSTAGSIVMAWVGTLPVAAILAAGVAWGLG